MINLSRGSTFQGLKGDPAMNINLTKSQIGLDGVPAAETVLSHVDGERGELIIAGEYIATSQANRASRASPRASGTGQPGER